MTRFRNLLQFFCVLLLLAGATIAPAQTPPSETSAIAPTEREHYSEWLSLADRVETTLKERHASNAVLEQLRREVADYREAYGKAKDQDTTRIKSLESQLETLGPKPEGDATEPEDIALLRQSLNEQLNQLRVPQVVAEEAYFRANGLISEIDRVIRERQRSRLLSRGPSPLNPVHWPEAVSDITSAVSGVIRETHAAWLNRNTADALKKDWPVLLLALVVGLVLMVRGGHWSERLGDYLRRFGGRGTGVWSFVVSLTRMALPLAGLFAVCAALKASGLLGLRGTMVIEAVPGWGMIYLVFRWLGDRIYAPGSEERIEFKKPHHRAEARLLVLLLALMLILNGLLGLYRQIENISDSSLAVAAFPPILLSALILLRLQKIGMRRLSSEPEAPDDAPQRKGVGSVIVGFRNAVVLLGVFAPVLAALGYLTAAQAIIYPIIMTLALVSAGITLQRFIVSIYGLLTGEGDAARETLFAALIGMLLAVLALPVLALIWGARIANLTELWDRFLTGFDVGGVQISPANFLTFALIFSVGYVITRLVQSALRTNLLPRTRIDPGGQNAIVSGLGYVGIFLAAVVAITGAGIDLSSLAIVAGALSVGIGFGLQTIVSNFVSGIILLIERPISKGDWIEVGGLMGYVRDISVRSTRIETFDRTDVIVPNSDLISGTVTNFTHGNTIGRVIAPVGVAYGTDTRKVEKILGEIANAHPMVLANPAPTIVFQGFGADSLDFEIRAILRDVNWVLSVKSDMNHEIAKRFAEEGIEIPFAQRDIWLRNPEVLRPSGDES